MEGQEGFIRSNPLFLPETQKPFGLSDKGFSFIWEHGAGSLGVGSRGKVYRSHLSICASLQGHSNGNQRLESDEDSLGSSGRVMWP
jgi:hypothetical protein